MNLLVFNLATDEDHLTLAFSARWIRELAARFDGIDVVSWRVGRHTLPGNVTVHNLTLREGNSRWLKVLRFYCTIFTLLRRRRYHVVFSHMDYLMVILFRPLSWFFRIEIVLWYAHRSVTPLLRVAHRCVDAVVTSTSEGFRIASTKINIIGQGVEIEIFVPKKQPTEFGAGPVRAVTVGRISRSKRIDLMIRSLAGWRGNNWELAIIGDPLNDEDNGYRRELETLCSAENLGHKVRFLGRKPPAEIAETLRHCDIFLNLSETGSLDKAIVEAMATATLVLSSNESFKQIARSLHLEALTVENSLESVRAGLERLLGFQGNERRRIEMVLSREAQEKHSREGLVSRVAALLTVHARE